MPEEDQLFIEDVKLMRRRIELVQNGFIPPLTCGKCEALIFHYVRAKPEAHNQDMVYFKCAGCDLITWPGLEFINRLREEVEKYDGQ